MKTELVHDLAKMREAALIDTLDERRKESKCSFRDLAKASGISHSTINDIFRRKQIKLWHVYVFAESLGMSMREVIYLSDVKFREEYDLLDGESEETSETATV